MLKIIGKWLNVYEDEIRLFLWTFFLYFLVTSSNVILNNYAETAFLKRYGVEYLPIVYMLNSIALFIIMGALTGIMVRVPGARILSYLFVFCGVSVAGIRFLIPFNIDLIYPVLFMLKAQYEALLGLLFWNLANDLFNTRQSKRLFSLITAGGVIGSIIGSFGTPFLAKAITLDNLLLCYLAITLVGAMLVKRMGKEYPTLLFSDKKNKKSKTRRNLFGEFKKILPLMKESSLIKILILLTFLPNIIIPILNYQFNYAVNAQFATESGLIQFFGYFRGFLNIGSLIILLFVGRIYGRWGLPVALMFHPANYVFAFLAFLLRFDIFAAIYARVSTMILRTTINNPARNILMGLIPDSLRSVLRPFLRGTVVRVGLLLGSGMILISEKFFNPRYLSLVAIPFAAAWLASAFALKKGYPKILLDLVSKDMLDLKALGDTDMEHVFSGKGINSQLLQAFLDSRGNRSLWYARLLKTLGIKDLDRHLLIALGDQDDRTRIGLVALLSPKSGERAASLLMDLAKSEKNQDLTLAALQATNRLDPEFSVMFDYDYFTQHHDPEIRAHALIGLYRREPEQYRPIIQSYLKSDAMKDRQTALIAAGGSGDKSFIGTLKEMLTSENNEPLVPDILIGLRNLNVPDLNDLVYPFLSHHTSRVRLAALSAIEINNDELLKKIILMMGDTSGDIFQLAQQKIESAPYLNTQLLVESLTIPNSRIRKAIFNLLESLGVKDIDVFRFARKQLRGSYQCLSDALSLEAIPESNSRNLLIDHFNHKKLLNIENILRILALQDSSGQMKIIYRGIFSSDSRKRANAMEALENMMDKRLFKEIVPLMESASPQESLNFGKKSFPLDGLDSGENAFTARLLADKDWVTVALTLDMIRDHQPGWIDSHLIFEFTNSENRFIRQSALKMIDQLPEIGEPQ
ncbi:MAG: Npt1/Npt2 family nucleotide transporter [Desulfobacterales bacterium]